MRRTGMQMLKPFGYAIAALVYLWLQGIPCSAAAQAYMVVTTSTAAPEGFASSVIQALTSQFTAQVTPNPLASNTYKIVLFSPNPLYQQPLSNLEQALSLGATVYAYGFTDGQRWDQHVQENLVGEFALNCSTPIVGVPMWDVGTCEAVTGGILGQLYQQSLSTPTVLFGGNNE